MQVKEIALGCSAVFLEHLFDSAGHRVTLLGLLAQQMQRFASPLMLVLLSQTTHLVSDDSQ